MLKTIAWKETREILPVIVLTLLVQTFAICVGFGFQLGFISDSIRYYVRPPDTIPFIDDQLCFWLSLICSAGAIAVGLRQTTWESNRGTFQFLLHRPLSRCRIIATKLLTGGLATLLISIFPILYYALWANSSATHASPFAWSMASSAFQYCVLVLLLYQGAFFSGLRPAKWYASRFLPLFGGILAAILLRMVSSSPESAQVLLWGWSIGVLGTLLASAVLIVGILDVARNCDFS